MPMKKMIFSFLVFIFLTYSSINISYSQSVYIDKDGYNSLSLKKTHQDYIMWNRILWQKINMKEKINRPFFAESREISKFLIEAVLADDLIPYKVDDANYDSALVQMKKDEFINNISVSEGEDCSDISLEIRDLMAQLTWDDAQGQYVPNNILNQVRQITGNRFWGLDKGAEWPDGEKVLFI